MSLLAAPLPSGMSVKDWFDAVMLEISSPWAFGKLENEADWQSHAVNFIRAAPFFGRTLPDPYQFADWREWAMRAYPMLESR